MKFIDAKEEDFNEIKGKNINTLKFAMMVAIAGRHNIMAIGEPGCGKTLMFDKFPLIMPKLNNEEAITVNRIFELANIHRKDKLVRPFCIPHQTASIEGMCGGGARMLLSVAFTSDVIDSIRVEGVQIVFQERFLLHTMVC